MTSVVDFCFSAFEMNEYAYNSDDEGEDPLLNKDTGMFKRRQYVLCFGLVHGVEVVFQSGLWSE